MDLSPVEIGIGCGSVSRQSLCRRDGLQEPLPGDGDDSEEIEVERGVGDLVSAAESRCS
jgi:hypothetical protein